MAAIANLTTYISGEGASFLNTIEKTRGGLRALVNSLDPVAAASARYNRSVVELDKALKNNQISLAYHRQLTDQLTARYQQQIAGQSSVTTSVGQMRAGMQQLSFQIGDVAQQFATGTSPMVIFAQQGGQVIQAIQMMSSTSSGLISFLAGPWGAVITGGAMILGTLASKYFDGSAAAKAKAEAAKALKQQMDALYDSNMRAVKSEQRLQQETLNSAFSLWKKAEATRLATQQKLKDSLVDAKIAQIADRASDSGGFAQQVRAGQRVADIQKQLAESQKETAKTWASVQAARIPILQGMASETDKATGSTRRYDRSVDDLNQRLIKGKIGQAEYRAEYGRLTAAHAAQQEALSKTREKRTGLTEAERDARQAARQAEKDAREYTQTLNSLQDKYDPLTAAVRKYREELEKIASLKGADLQLAPTFREGAFEEYAKARAGILGGVIGIDGIRDEANVDDRRDKRAQDIADSQRDAIEMAKREYELIGASDQVRERELGRLRLIQTLRREGITSEMEKYDVIMRQADAYDELIAKTEKQAETTAYVRDIGGQMIDEVFNVNNFEDWGEAGKRILKMLQQEFLILSAINPLKNMLFNQDLPTLGDIGKGFSIGKLFGGSKIAAGDGANGLDAIFKTMPRIPGLANGGDFIVGGRAGIDRNLLSINGMPRAMVSASERVTVNPANDRGSANDRPVKVYIIGEESSAFTPRVAGISGNVSTQQISGVSRLQARRGRSRLA